MKIALFIFGIFGIPVSWRIMESDDQTFLAVNYNSEELVKFDIDGSVFYVQRSGAGAVWEKYITGVSSKLTEKTASVVYSSANNKVTLGDEQDEIQSNDEILKLVGNQKPDAI